MSEKMNASPERIAEDLEAILNHRSHVWGTTQYGPCAILRQPKGFAIELKGPGLGVETELRVSSTGAIENLGSKKLTLSHGATPPKEERLRSPEIDLDELIGSFRESAPTHPKKPGGSQAQLR
ncbi:hypothetical protein HZA44_03845 [Candidatus Peregrinibacteria bacterium]|nr:hypothetical protein [Candidatus Peregrinibacteria bacterium]